MCQTLKNKKGLVFMVDPTNDKMAELMLENEKLKKQLVCKRCGFDNNEELIKTDDNLRKEYYKCLLAQKPFVKKYDIMDGFITITCVEPLQKALAAYGNCWDKLGNTIVQYGQDLLCMLVIEKLERRTDEGFEVMYETTAEERTELLRSISLMYIEKVIPEAYQNLPQVVLLAIKSVASVFTDFCTKLSAEALDANFWKGVGQN